MTQSQACVFYILQGKLDTLKVDLIDKIMLDAVAGKQKMDQAVIQMLKAQDS